MTSDLASRLREAKEGSRELDARVWCEANDCDFIIDTVAGKAVAKSRADKPLWHLGKPFMWLGWVDPGEHSLNFTPLSDMEMPNGPIPEFTTDLSAAVALCERALGDWTIARISQDDNKRWWVELREGFLTSYRRVVITGPKDDAAYALTLAILTAKEKANVD